MYSNTELENYKLQVELLQQKLLKSEESRENLEKQLDHIHRKQIDLTTAKRKNHRRHFEQFLEEQKQHSQRNQMLLQTLERIDQHAKALANRTEQLKRAKLQYEMQLMHSQSIQANTTSPITVLVPTAAIPSGSTTAVSGVPIASLPSVNSDKNINHNNTVPRLDETTNLTTCQWTLTMATPLTSGMLLMPTTTVMPQLRAATSTHSLYSPNENLYDNRKNSEINDNNNNNNENNNKNNENNNKNNLENENFQVTDAQPEDIIAKHDSDVKNELKNENYVMKTVQNEPLTIELPEVIEHTKGYVENTEQIPEDINFTNTNDLSYEEYFDQKSKEHPNMIVNEEELAEVENAMAELNLNNEHLNTSNMNIDNIENAIYGELVNPLEENSLHTTENVEKSALDIIDDYNYGPTLVTTEAELYPQPGLENTSNMQDPQEHEQELEQQQAEDYENDGYTDYTGTEYENVYAENTNYPGYTYDENTGQYTPNEQLTYEEQPNNTEFEYETGDQAQIPTDYAYNNYTEPETETQQESNKAAETEDTISPTVNAENMVPINNTPAPTQKLVKPILASNNNDAQKKKKRVNFVDSSDTDDSSKAGKVAVGNVEANATVSSESDFDFSATENVQLKPTNEKKK